MERVKSKKTNQGRRVRRKRLKGLSRQVIALLKEMKMMRRRRWVMKRIRRRIVGLAIQLSEVSSILSIEMCTHTSRQRSTMRVTANTSV